MPMPHSSSRLYFVRLMNVTVCSFTSNSEAKRTISTCGTRGVSGTGLTVPHRRASCNAVGYHAMPRSVPWLPRCGLPCRGHRTMPCSVPQLHAMGHRAMPRGTMPVHGRCARLWSIMQCRGASHNGTGLHTTLWGAVPMPWGSTPVHGAPCDAVRLRASPWSAMQCREAPYNGMGLHAMLWGTVQCFWGTVPMPWGSVPAHGAPSDAVSLHACPWSTMQCHGAARQATEHYAVPWDFMQSVPSVEPSLSRDVPRRCRL